MWGGVEHLKGEEGESLLSAIPDPAPSPEELVERAEEQHRLYALIQQLPSKQRALAKPHTILISQPFPCWLMKPSMLEQISVRRPM